MPWYLDLRAPQLLGECSCSQACASAQTISTEQPPPTIQMCYSGSLGRSASAACHTVMRQLLLFRTGCCGLAVDLGRGSGIAGAERSCALCGACPGDEMHLVFKCAALQMLRNDMPSLFQGVCSMQCFVWQDNMVLMSRFVRDGMWMVRAASSGNELDV